jgi:hypothetical protein
MSVKSLWYKPLLYYCSYDNGIIVCNAECRYSKCHYSSYVMALISIQIAENIQLIFKQSSIHTDGNTLKPNGLSIRNVMPTK